MYRHLHLFFLPFKTGGFILTKFYYLGIGDFYNNFELLLKASHFQKRYIGTTSKKRESF